jgi:hypothetical protein
MKVRFLAALLSLLSLPALAQNTVLQGGTWTPGHTPMYSGSGLSTPIIQDSGTAGGGASGVGLSEVLQTSRATSSVTTAPYANSGNGPLNTHNCFYDAPITSSSGYHYLCLDANAQGGGLIAYGAGGGAITLPLQFIINGTYWTPGSSSGSGGSGGGLGSINASLLTGTVPSMVSVSPISLTAGSLPSGVTVSTSNLSGSVFTTETALISSFHPITAPSSLQTTGYATDGDLGAALFVNVSSAASYCGFSITLYGGATAYYALTGDTIRPEMCGPTSHTGLDSTSATNNTSSIQAAINYFQSQNNGMSSGKVLLSQFAINSTISLSGSVTLEGTGWGSTLATGSPQSVLTWVGSAGVDMIQVINNWGASIKKIRFAGSTTNPPYAAIDFSTSATGAGDVIFNTVEDVWVGSMYSSDQGGQFYSALTGIYGSGTSATYSFSGATVLPVGSQMIIMGAVPTGYNGQCTITASSAGSATCANTTTGSMTQTGTLYGQGQFNHGIAFTGTINGDSHILKNITIIGTNGEAIYDSNPNASNIDITRLNIYTALACIYTKASMQIYSMFCSGTPDYSFKLGISARINVFDFYSESSAALLQLEGASTAFTMHNSRFQIMNGFVRTDGKIVDVNGQSSWNIDFDNSGVQYNLGTDPSTITLNLSNYPSITTGRFRCVGCANLWPSNFNFGNMVWTNDSRNIEYSPLAAGGQDVVPKQVMLGNWNTANGASDSAWQTWRNDFAGKFNVFGGPFYVRQLQAPVNVAATASLGSGSTTYGYRITALTYDGETLPSTEVTVTNASSLNSATATNKLTWNPEIGAYAYKIYGRTSGAEQLLATVTWDSLHGAYGVRSTAPYSWTDDGSLTPSGSLPTLNTTGNAEIDGTLRIAPSNPTLSSCGTSPSITTDSSSNGGQFTIGGGTIYGCTITFAHPFSTNAKCVISAANTNASSVSGVVYVSASSKTAFTVSTSLSAGNAAFNYICNGY